MRTVATLLALFASAASATRGLALTPPLGWSSWTSYGCSVTGANLSNSADLLVSSSLAKAGYDIIHVDDW
jgi:alpha-galactosidase